MLAQAGYKSGADFPKLDIYVNTKEGSTIYKMMTGVVDNIKKTLGVELKIKLCTIQERNEAIIKGTAKLWRGGWIADYPDAENFLTLFYGKNISDNEMLKTFNCGIGLLIFVDRNDAKNVINDINNVGYDAFLIGSMEKNRLHKNVVFDGWRTEEI